MESILPQVPNERSVGGLEPSSSGSKTAAALKDAMTQVKADMAQVKEGLEMSDLFWFVSFNGTLSIDSLIGLIPGASSVRHTVSIPLCVILVKYPYDTHSFIR